MNTTLASTSKGQEVETNFYSCYKDSKWTKNVCRENCYRLKGILWQEEHFLLFAGMFRKSVPHQPQSIFPRVELKSSVFIHCLTLFKCNNTLAKIIVHLGSGSSRCRFFGRTIDYKNCNKKALKIKGMTRQEEC